MNYLIAGITVTLTIYFVYMITLDLKMRDLKRRLDAREVADEPAAPLREHPCARPLRPLIFRPSVPVVDVHGINPASRPAEVYDKIGHYAVPKKTL